jgi:hypothetical protein
MEQPHSITAVSKKLTLILTLLSTGHYRGDKCLMMETASTSEMSVNFIQATNQKRAIYKAAVLKQREKV